MHIATEPPIDSDDKAQWVLLRELHKEFSEMPAADVEEVKHGYWKHSVEFGFVAKYHFWNCSLCGVASEDEGNEKYCRECGAKMDGVRKNDL